MSARNLPLPLLPDTPSQGKGIALQSAGVVRDRAKARVTLPYRPDIDGLRGLAVGLVVAYHAFPLVRSGGFIGVDVFFVISGYLISQLILRTLQAGTFSLSDFYRRRARRIVPALLVMLAACCLVGWLLMLPSELKWLGSSIKWCVPFLANLYFARTGGGYFEPSTELNPLVHLWSLAVEEQFYIVWPVLLAFAVRCGITMRFMGVVFALSLSFSIWSAWHGTPHFYAPATRAWELALGGLLAAWQGAAPGVVPGRDAAVRVAKRLGAHTISVLGLILIIVGGVCWNTDRGIPGGWTLLPTCGAVLLLAAGRRTVSSWFLASPPMVLLGRISYPLYLWHWPTLAFTRVVLGHHPHAGMASIEMGFACLASYGTYRLIESPIRYGQLGRNAAVPLLAALALFTVAGLAFDRGWIPGRLSGPLVARWNQAVNDWHYPGEKADPRTGFGVLTVTSHRKRTTLLIGDSHIQQYWPRVQHLIDTYPDSARSAMIAGYPACPPVPGVPRPWPKTNCSGFFDYAMKQARQADVDTVVFAAFWEYYFLGEYSPDVRSPHVYGIPASARVWLPLDSPEARTALEGFREAVSSLVSSGRRVFIVLSNPTSPEFEPHFPVELRLRLHPPASLPPGSAPQVDAQSFEAFVAPLMDRLREIAAQGGAQVLDPRSTLCAHMLCPTADPDGFPLYLDSNHLNGGNARERASFIDQTLFGPDMPRAADVTPDARLQKTQPHGGGAPLRSERPQP